MKKRARKRAKNLGIYTVEDAIEHVGFGPFQIFATAILGIIWVSDALELMLVVVMVPLLKCEWNLDSWEEALLTGIVFVGFFFGSLSWGAVADSVGRKTSLLIVCCVIFVCGLLSAASPSYSWLLFFRFLVGFGVGGCSQSVTYYVEFLSSKLRGPCTVLLALWWAVGSMSAAALALAVIPNFSQSLSWRLYLCFCALPVIVAVIFMAIFMPESARYYVSKGQIEKGEKIIKRIAWYNRTTPPSVNIINGRLVSQEEKDQLTAETEDNIDETVIRESVFNNEDSSKEDSSNEYESLILTNGLLSPTKSPLHSTSRPWLGHIDRLKAKIVNSVKDFGQSIKLLFVGKGWRTTVPLLFIWCGCALVYYGLVLLTTSILKEGYSSCGIGNETSDEECDNLMTSSYYIDIVWTTSAEIPGILVTMVLIELIGRKVTMAAEFVGTGVFIGLLLICVPEVYLGVFLFGARGFATGVFQAAYVYTPEVYPTQYRGFALGLMISAARIGMLLTPFISQVLYQVNNIAAILLYVGSCVVLAVLALLLPIETKGRSLN